MPRHLVLTLAAAVLLTACGAPALPGAASGPMAGSLSAAGKPKPGATAKALPFAQLVVNEVVALRDGGTVIAKGYVTRSTYVSVKFDGDLASQTRGQIFVEAHDFMQPDGAFRPLAPEEVAPLLAGLKSNMTRAGSGLNTETLGHLIDLVAKANEQPVAEPGAAPKVVGLKLDKLPVRCPCFELSGTFEGQPLSVKFEGMPGGYTIDAVTLGGKAVDEPARRKAIAAALRNSAGDLGPKAMQVEDVAEALEQ